MPDNSIAKKVFWHDINDKTHRPIIGREYLVFFGDLYQMGVEWCFGVGRARSYKEGWLFDCYITPKPLSISQPTHWGTLEAPIDRETKGEQYARF